MGQVLSNIVRCICGEAEDDEERRRCPALSSNSSTSDALLQTLLTSSLRSDSCSDTSPYGRVDLHGDSSKSDALHQNILGLRQLLNSGRDSSAAGALHQNILISAHSNSDSYPASASQQENLISSASSESLRDSSSCGTSIPPSSVDLLGDSTKSAELHQNILIFPQCSINSHRNSSSAGALHQNILIPQQSFHSNSESSPADALQQAPLISFLSSDSCSDSSPCGTFIPPSSVDLHEDSSKSKALHQNILDFPQCLDFCGDSSAAGALHQNILISSPSSESLSESSTDSPFFVPTVFVDSYVEVVEEKGQITPSLSEVNSIKPSKREEEEEVIIRKEVVIKERWIKHYSNHQKILLVGDGDFSFSASLAVAFGSATNMIATSLNSKGYLKSNYKNAMSNIQNLKSRGCKVMHGVDATKMASNLLLKGWTFDRIVFNFPLTGFFPNESRESQLNRYRKLVGMFLANANKMIGEEGEIHISHKSNGFFREWNLELLASSKGLELIEEVHFNFTDYPGYHTKYGFGGDKNFNCNPSKTYKFGLKNCQKQSLQSSYWIMK